MALRLDFEERDKQDAEKRDASREPERRGVWLGWIICIVARFGGTTFRRIEYGCRNAVSDSRAESSEGLE